MKWYRPFSARLAQHPPASLKNVSSAYRACFSASGVALATLVLAMVRALKPRGRIALVEYRAEDPRVPIKALHKMSEAQAIVEMEKLGLRWLETLTVLPQQHLIFVEKPAH